MAADARFKRPGSLRKSAFGVQFDLDRDTKAEPALPPPPPASSQPHTSLPISKHRSEFLYLVENHAVTIVAGETGSGKTTQIPLYLLESGWCSDGYQVVCTQPRRAAAAQVAQRVAEETRTQIGTTIGFCARFQDVLTPGVTQVKFTTDEALLNEIRQDPLLTAYSVVVVDEVHERSLPTDLLLALLRKIMRQRPTLRIVIASATMDVQKFLMFFSNAHPHRQGGSAHPQPPSTSTAGTSGHTSATPSGVPAVLSVEGRLYPVQEHFLTAPASDYLRTATNTALEIHRAEVPGDILVFVATSGEVQQCMDVMHDALQGVAMRSLSVRLQPLPLHGGIPAPQLAAIFQPTPRNTRRVIFATNMAETSLTIEGVVYVIDTLHSRQSVYDPFVDLDAQAVAPISGAAARQRGGRAGRVRPGHCFRICTEDAFKGLKDHNVPEIQRSHLAASLLQLKALGIDNIMTFPWLDPPPAETAVRAMEQLYALGAVNEHARLTSDVGVKMSELPLPPPMAAALINAARSGCSEEVAAVAALTSVRSVWSGSRSKAAKEARAKFAVAEGDLLTYLNVYRAWREHSKSPQWAFRHFVNHKALLRAEDIRLQLRACLKSLGEALTSCDDDPVPICKALVSGYFLSACRYMTTTYDGMRADDRGTHMYAPFRAAQSSSIDAVRVAVDENSVLAHVKCPWLVFVSSTQAADGTWRVGDVLATDAETLAAAAPHVFDYVARKKVPDLS